MKFSVGAVLAFAAAVLAKPILTNSNYEVTEGVPFTLTWSNAQGPVTITLMTGPSGNLKKVTDLTTGETGNSYTYTPPSNLPSGSYAFRITDSTNDPNYSPSFEYVGTGTASSTGSATTASASSTSDSASSTTSSDSSSSASSTASSTASSSDLSSSTSSSASSSVTSSSASSTLSTTTTSSTPSTTRAATTNTPANSNNGQRFASPLALVLVTVAALVFFN